MKENDSPYLELAAAIIRVAVKDYEAAYKHLLKHPDSRYAKDSVEREKRFFYGGWFEMLADNLDGPRLVSMVEMKVRNDMKKKEVS